MSRKHLKYAGLAAAALGLAGALVWNSAPASADDYRKLAYGLKNSLKAQGLSRLAISDFLARGAGQEEAAYAQQRLSEALFEDPGIGLMDVSVLRKIKGRSALWPNVLIKGEVYPTEKGVAVIVKALDPRTGGLIRTMQIETGGLKAAGREKENFRDSPGGERSQACVELRRLVRDWNRSAVDLKARYWALKLREPEFSASGVERLPGNELSDYRTRQKFYELINAYYEQDGPVTITEQELAEVLALREKEAAADAECRAGKAPPAAGR